MRNKPIARTTPERDAQIIALRLKSPLRPLDRTSAPVDGLGLFDVVRSPSLF